MESNGTLPSSPKYDDDHDHEHTYANFISKSADCEDAEIPGENNSKMTSNGDARSTTSDVKQLVVDEEEDDDDNPQCGWFGLRPSILQCCNNPKGYLFFICIFAVAQGMTVNGIIYVITTTLERRFNLTSARSGFISSCYDFSVMVVIVFVTYLGEKGHKPRWIGTGAFIFALGSLLFTVPHFATGFYEPRQSLEFPTCNVNGTGNEECSGGGETGLSNYYWVFVAAQVLHGLGASPLYTLGVTFLDDNVRATSLAVYIGIFQAMSTLGPAVGYLVGGAFLTFYTDVSRDPADVGLTSESPLWVGAWWLGFFFSAALCLTVAIPILGFPRALPGAKALEKSRIESAHKGSDFSARAGFGNRLRDFPRAVLNLLKNIPFMCLSGAAITEWFILASIAVFGPKYLESQFNLTSGTAALIAGVQVIPSALIGCLVGGFLVRYFKLEFRGMIKFCIVVMVISLLGFSCFFIVCPNADFAGVTVTYDDKYPINSGRKTDLNATCNSDCNCLDGYDPVCGSDDVLYYSPCHAGCFGMEEADGVTEYSDCRCINNGTSPSAAVTGKCAYTCNSQWAFFALIMMMLISTFFAIVPSITATLRCVANSQRAFALGVNSLLYRALGTVPGPVIYGTLIDQSCLIWEEDCDGARSCWMYDNRTMAKNALILNGCLKIGSILFFIGALVFYKPEAEENEQDSDDKELTNNKETGKSLNGNGKSDRPMSTEL